MKRPSRSALIVSDSAPLRRYAAAALESGGFECSEAANGFEAIEHLRRHRFPLYVVDVDMARTDGLPMFAIALNGDGPGHAPPTIVGCTRSGGRLSSDSPWSDPAIFAILLPTPFRPAELLEAAEAALDPTSR